MADLTFAEAMDALEAIRNRLSLLTESGRVQQVMNDEVRTIEYAVKAMTAGRGSHIVLGKYGTNSSSVTAKGPMIPYLRPALLKQHSEGQQRIEDAIRQEAGQ